jgi:uncharacterized protein YxjI
MGSPQQYEITELGLSGSQYTVEQTGQDENLRPEYEARNVSGEVIFRCIYNMYENPDTFSFADQEGNTVASVEATGTLDVAGDYVLKDTHTGDDLVVLDNDFSLFQDSWRIRDLKDGSLLAKIESRGGLITVARKFLPAGQFVGHRFEITDEADRSIGTIESDFAIHDQYDITITDSSSVPIDPILTGTVVIDAIQGN